MIRCRMRKLDVAQSLWMLYLRRQVICRGADPGWGADGVLRGALLIWIESWRSEDRSNGGVFRGGGASQRDRPSRSFHVRQSICH